VAQASKEGYPRERIIDLGPVDEGKILRCLEETSQKIGGRIALFGCGNMIGIEGFIHRFENLSETAEDQIVGAQR
jgi:hypothetical protein